MESVPTAGIADGSVCTGIEIDSTVDDFGTAVIMHAYPRELAAMRARLIREYGSAGR